MEFKFQKSQPFRQRISMPFKCSVMLICILLKKNFCDLDLFSKWWLYMHVNFHHFMTTFLIAETKTLKKTNPQRPAHAIWILQTSWFDTWVVQNCSFRTSVCFPWKVVQTVFQLFDPSMHPSSCLHKDDAPPGTGPWCFEGIPAVSIKILLYCWVSKGWAFFWLLFVSCQLWSLQQP